MQTMLACQFKVQLLILLKTHKEKNMSSIKYINIFVCSSQLPSEIEILSQNGLIIKTKRHLHNISKLCVCTCFDSITVLAKFQNQTQRKTICLSNCACQEIWLNFNFSRQRNFLQTFRLFDRNYGFAIKKATLLFVKK